VAAITAAAVKELRDRTSAGMMECKKALAEADGDLDRAIAVLRERGLAKADKRAGRETTEGAIAMVARGGHGALVELGCETDFVARTDEFQALAGSLATAAAADANATSPEALADADASGESVSERLKEAISTLGENIVVKRVQRLEVESGVVGGYVHAGGKLGVLVAVRTAASGDGLQEVTKDLAMHVAAADPTPVAIDRSGIDADAVAAERDLFEKQARQSGKPEKVIDKIVSGRLNKFFSEICLLEQSFVKDPDQSVGAMLEAAGKNLGGELEVTDYIRYRLGESTDS
jgi:elongation factor Ts